MMDLRPESPPPAMPPAAPASPKRGPWGFWATLGFSAAVVAGLVGVSFGVAVVVTFVGDVLGIDALRGKHLAETLRSGLWPSICYNFAAGVIVGLTVLFAWLRRGYPLKEYLGLRKPTGRQMGFWVLAIVALMAAADAVTYFVLHKPIVPPSQVEMYETAGFVPLFFLTLVIAAPVCEEMLFRGFMLEGFSRSKIGPVAAVLVTSALWAVVHIQYDGWGIATIFLTGLLLGAVRLKTGSLWLAMLLHGINNLAAGIETVLAAHFGPHG